MLHGCLLVLSLLGADAYTDTFTAANAAYQSGHYAEAARGYEQLVASRVEDAELFVNLGNSYFRLGHIGGAIANYERALRLAPSLESARENLDFALQQTQRKLPRPAGGSWQQALLFWDDALPYASVRTVAIACWIAFWAVLALFVWRRIPYLRIAAAFLLFFSLLAGLSAWDKAHPLQLAVASAETVPVRYGKSDTETIRFELYEGDRVAVEAVEGDWARVTTVDGERGWAQSGLLAFVGPPYRAAPPVQAVTRPPGANAPSAMRGGTSE